MKLPLAVLCLSLAAHSSAQLFRQGWLTEAATDRLPESWSGVTVDKDGNLITAGTYEKRDQRGAQKDIVVRKSDPLGRILWEVKFGLDRSLNDFVQNVVTDSIGDVYISASTPTNGRSNFALVRLSGATGAQVWKKILPTPDQANPLQIALAPDGSIVQTGGGGTNGRERFLTVKWSNTGNVLWQKTWSNDPSGDRSAQALSIAPNGDITVVGYANVPNRGHEQAIIRYDANGNERWVTLTGGTTNPSRDRAMSVTTFSNGDAIVGGSEYVQGSAFSLTVMRLNAATGAITWKFQALDPRNLNGEVTGIALFGDTIYAGLAANPGNTGDDLGVVALSDAGERKWATWLTGSGRSVDIFSGITTDIYGDIYIAGAIVETTPKPITAKLSPAGNILWQFTNSAAATSVTPSGVAVANDSGHVFTAGNLERGVNDDQCISTFFQAPRAVADLNSVTQGEKITGDVKRNDIFARFATIEKLSDPEIGTLEFDNQGRYTYTAPADFEGEVSFRYALRREGLDSSETTVRITVVKKPNSN